MNILICNDDGIFSKGLLSLAKILYNKHDLTIVAPDGNRSGFSRSMSFHKEIKVIKQKVFNDVEAYSLSGTPADCVKFALTTFNKKFDLVVCGINLGPNLGNDIFYSGTVNACFEGNLFDIPAIAFSNVAFKDFNFETCERFISNNFDKIVKMSSKEYTLNINIPNIEYKNIKGVKICKSGDIQYSDGYVKIDEKTYKLIGEPIPPTDKDLGTDVYYSYLGYVTITPVVHSIINEEIFNKLKEFEF